MSEKHRYEVYAIRYTMDNGNCVNSRRNFLTETIANNEANAKAHVRRRFRMTEGIQMEYAGDKADYMWLEAKVVD